MIQFVKQTVGQECSKMNRLSTLVASYLHETRYFDAACHATAVTQCADGIVLGTPAGWSGKRMLVLHDWNPAYRQQTFLAKTVVCVGRFDHPEFGRKTIHINSYPLDVDRFVEIPDATDYDVVIGGSLKADSADVLDGLLSGTEYGRAAVVCRSVATGTAWVHEAISAVLKKHGVQVAVLRRNLPECVLETMYLSAPAIVHLGDCGRGWLHSLGEYRSRAKNVKLKCRKEFGDADITSAREFVARIEAEADALH